MKKNGAFPSQPRCLPRGGPQGGSRPRAPPHARARELPRRHAVASRTPQNDPRIAPNRASGIIYALRRQMRSERKTDAFPNEGTQPARHCTALGPFFCFGRTKSPNHLAIVPRSACVSLFAVYCYVGVLPTYTLPYIAFFLVYRGRFGIVYCRRIGEFFDSNGSIPGASERNFAVSRNSLCRSFQYIALSFTIR